MENDDAADALREYTGVDMPIQQHMDRKRLMYHGVDFEAEEERLIRRHRLNLARVFYGQDGGYSLRKIKRIYWREMKENPDRYLLPIQDVRDMVHMSTTNRQEYYEHAAALLDPELVEEID